jgi:hypothetical protein
MGITVRHAGYYASLGRHMPIIIEFLAAYLYPSSILTSSVS